MKFPLYMHIYIICVYVYIWIYRPFEGWASKSKFEIDPHTTLLTTDYTSTEASMHATVPPNIDSSAYDFQGLSEGNYLPNATAYQHFRNSSEPLERQHSKPVYSRQRAQWTDKEDMCLLQAVLAQSHILARDIKCKIRKLFWHHVCQGLTASFAMSMNRRQCRDRFKLLYQRSASRTRFESYLPPTTEVEKLCDECTRTFRFNEHRELILATDYQETTHTPRSQPSAPVSGPATELSTVSSNSTLQSPYSTSDYQDKEFSSSAVPTSRSVPAPVPYWNGMSPQDGSSHTSPLQNTSNKFELQVPVPAAPSSWDTQNMLSNIVAMQRQVNQLSQQVEALTNIVSLNGAQSRLYQPIYTDN
ncbi:LANO_0D10022g1_1 [Lachancea nothofagi CBS 11611]|uniref:LANO_0D10022g1_1 n=1 Tax=Lachancea nothofagi CBS 11611 TaxID=1266666 RepID=A0A1G4JJV9_9SACH|nr:LANO_0D10022g1_1 [Lachancea nothofagi CBS 11611]